MRFSVSAVAAVLAMATSVVAQAPTKDFDPVTKPTSDEKIPAGSTYTIEWDAPAKYADGTISISLIGGATQDTQVPLADVASGVQNSAGSYDWAVPADLGDKAVYGLVFKLESNTDIFQYSNPFHITAGSGSGSSSASGDATTTVTKDNGVKTVTLSTTSTSTTPTTTSTSCESTSTSWSTAWNSTTSWAAKPTQTIVTSTKLVSGGSGSPTTSVAEPSQTGAAPRVGASSVALIGAMAMAYFAL